MFTKFLLIALLFLGLKVVADDGNFHGSIQATNITSSGGSFIGDGSQLTGVTIPNLTSLGSNIGIGSTAPGSTIDIVGNIRVSGTITGTTASSMGGSIQTATNQACNTTCGHGCMVGFNIGVLGVALGHIVNCTDATADECLCMGPS